jgi:hypothetical protein
MIDKQEIVDYAKRETIQGRDLIQILFGKKVPEIIEWWIANRWYSKSNSKSETRRSIANEKLANSILARFHPSPNLVDLKKGLIDIEVDVQEFCSWFLVKADQLSDFTLSPTAQLFVDTALGSATGKKPKAARGRPPFPYSDAFVKAVKDQNKKGVAENEIPFRATVTNTFAMNVLNEGKAITPEEYKTIYGWSLRKVRENVKKALSEQASKTL